MLNNSGPRYKRSQIERRMNRDIFSCIGILFLMCLIGAVGMECSGKNNPTGIFCFFCASTQSLSFLIYEKKLINESKPALYLTGGSFSQKCK